MEGIGAPGAGLIVALENLFPPLPSEIILPLAGFTASRGSFSPGRGAAMDHHRLSARSMAALWDRRPLRDRMRAIARRLPLVDVAAA
jgi:hypothetical protein